jgi:RNA polymerase sigma-70 factor, ECF subfamily
MKAETVKTRLHRARALLRRALVKQLEPSLEGVLPFEAMRCDRVVSAVLARIIPH